MKRYKKNNSPQPKAKTIPIGIGINIAIFSVIALSVCAVLYNGNDPTGNLGLLSMLSLTVSGALSSFTVAKIGRAASVGISAALSSALIFIAAALMINGTAGAKPLMNILCYLISSVIFSFLGSKKHTRHKKRPKH